MHLYFNGHNQIYDFMTSLKPITLDTCFGADCVIFDFDGTLCDSVGDIVEVFRVVLNEFGFPQIHPDHVKIGPPLEDMIRNVLGEAVPDGKEKDDLVNAIIPVYRQTYDQSDFKKSPLYPGALELLELLKAKKIPLALATYKRDSSTYQILNKKGIAPFFEHILCCNTDGKRWTKAEMLTYIEQKIGVEPQKTLFFGDSTTDMTAAQSTQTVSVAALYGYGNPEELIQLQPDYICKHLPTS